MVPFAKGLPLESFRLLAVIVMKFCAKAGEPESSINSSARERRVMLAKLRAKAPITTRRRRSGCRWRTFVRIDAGSFASPLV